MRLDNAFAAEGIEVRDVFAVRAAIEDVTRAAKMIRDVPLDSGLANSIPATDALAVKEEVSLDSIAGGVGFHQNVARRVVPIEGSAGFLDALTVAIDSYCPGSP